MKLGVNLYVPGRPATADNLIAQAKAADAQGFDSVWLGDHLLMDWMEPPAPESPLDSFTLMTAIGAVTERVRLGWTMLNASFRNPALLAKMLATLDQISHGRVICSIGSGWYEREYEAFDIPFIADHGERVAHTLEVIELMKTLWTTPAPERVTFEGRFVRVNDLPFSPAPYQQPHPEIWLGGDSDATLGNVKALADGWVLARAGLERIEEARSAPDWPARPLTIGKIDLIAVGETAEAADREAESFWTAIKDTPPGAAFPTLEAFREHAIVGDPDACLRDFAERQRRGQNYVMTIFRDAAHQERVARLLLPHLA